MRDITKVIAAMLDLIPAEETALRTELQSVANAALYRAPESAWMDWRAGEQCLARRFGRKPAAEGWGAEIVALWTGKTPIEVTN